MTTPRPLPYRPQPAPRGAEPAGLRAWLRPSHWVGALVIMLVFTAVLYVVQAVNQVHPLIEYGLQPRRAVGLRGVVTEPFLHADWNHLLTNTLPFLLIGWVVLLAGLREWLFVTALVVVGGGLLTWAIAPSNQVIVGASGLVFGWLGYLLARAVFSRMFKWIVTAVVVLICFGTLLFGLLPGLRQGVSWQAHLSGFVVGVALAALIHDPRGGPGLLGRITAPRKGTPVSPVRDVEAPIGVMDSGVGGLTVARAVLDQLPHEALHYVGDTAHSPYGPKPIAEIRAHALKIMDELVASGVKALVIACNTASSACLADARERYDVPVVEVVRPAVRRAVAATRNGRVGVIGTIATIKSGAYQDAFGAARDVEVTAAACPRFAEFVERGVTSGRQLLGLAEAYLAPLNAADVDTLVLGCTHYPVLTGLLSVVMGDAVTLVSSAEETAKDVYRVLLAEDLLRPDDAAPPEHVFRSTGSPDAFTRLSHRFLGPEVAQSRAAIADTVP